MNARSSAATTLALTFVLLVACTHGGDQSFATTPVSNKNGARTHDEGAMFIDADEPGVPATCSGKLSPLTPLGRQLGTRAERLLLAHHDGTLRAEAVEAFGSALDGKVFVLADSDFLRDAGGAFQRVKDERELEAIARARSSVVIGVHLSSPGQMQVSPTLVHVLYSSSAVDGRPLPDKQEAAGFGETVGYCVYERNGRVVFAELFRVQT